MSDDVAWSEKEIQWLVRRLKRMARMIGCEFVPDPVKLARLRRRK